MQPSRLQKQRGVALFVVMFALMLLAAVAFGMMYMADTETRINQNYRLSQVAYYGARAGLEEARVRLIQGQASSIVPPAGLPAVGSQNIVYLTNPSNTGAVEPWNGGNRYADNQLWQQNYAALGLSATSALPTGTNWYRNVASISPLTGQEGALPYKWVRIAMKANNTNAPYFVAGSSSNTSANNSLPVCWNGTNQVLLPSTYTACEMDPPPAGSGYMRNVYVLTAFSETDNTNPSRRMTQMEVAFDPPFVTNASVASRADVVLQGSHEISGYDNCSCACTTVSGVTTCTDRPGRFCDRSRYAVFTEGEIQSNGNSGQVVAGTTPVSQERASWPYDIEQLIDRYKNNPAMVQPFTNAQCPVVNTTTGQRSCGTRSGQVFGTYPTGLPDSPTGSVPQVTYLQGHVQLTSGATGSGILVVDGNLDIHGGLNWYGLILVRGVVQFTGGAGDSVNIYGGILAGQTVSAADTVIGGSVDLSYDLCALKQMDGGQPPLMLSSQEKIF